jgi:dTDP-4-amino-4,6-dideoxygalactose transaminase
MTDPSGTGPIIERDEFLPFFKPDVGEAEIAAVTEVLRSGWLTYGPKVREFGQACADYLGAPHAVPVSSCSAGLFLALKTLGVGPGDEVILPSLTFISTLTAVRHCGARPVLVDIDPANLGVDPAAVEAAITPATKVLLPVHLAGHPCRIDEIIALAARHGIRVVEDAAHSFGAAVGDRRIGTLGDMTVFSFYATKCITSGDGGLITTADDALAEKLHLLSFHGMDGNAWQRYGDKGRWYYEVVDYGYKLHLGDPAAALGLAQLGRSDEFMARRREIVERFNTALAGLPGVVTPAEADWATHAWHLYVLRVDRAVIEGGRDGLVSDLAASSIGSSVHFIPLHHHPVYREEAAEFAPGLVETDRYFDQAVSLPLFPSMTGQDVEDVITVVTESVRRRTR